MPEFLGKLVDQSKDPIEILGYAAQFVFFLRFFVQWLASERKKEVVIPAAFWWLSIAGGVMQAFYGVQKGAPNLFVAQSIAVFLYSRNMILDRRRRRALAGAGDGTGPLG
jgi:lipid-A-disaccharide synthase-like uncharacterized protein